MKKCNSPECQTILTTDQKSFCSKECQRYANGRYTGETYIQYKERETQRNNKMNNYDLQEKDSKLTWKQELTIYLIIVIIILALVVKHNY